MNNRYLYILFLSLALLMSGTGWAQLPDWLAPSTQRKTTDQSRPQQPTQQPRSSRTQRSNRTQQTPQPAQPAQADQSVDPDAPTLTQEQDSVIYGDVQFEETQQTEVEYNPENGYYIIHTKIGGVDIATPYMLNQDEYLSYSEREQMNRYWKQKISEVEHSNESKFDITDMKFNIGPADKVFGPGGVQLKMQGSAELLFGFKHQYIDNPSLSARSRNNNVFDFDEKIQASVNGKVGDKLNFNLNYNTEASFSFDQQNLKLSYKGKEDDIIQSIEAGNVTMDLNSSLIRGTQALFGVKVGLQFGRLKIQGLVSQQNSQSQSVSSEGGAQMTKFEVGIENYDENRHFFLNYFFRDIYESSMRTLPYVTSGVTINRIEVWITNKRGAYDQARNILALSDLGENKLEHISIDSLKTPHWEINPDGKYNIAPNNKANSEYDALLEIGEIRDIQQMTSVMPEKLVGGEDYEKLESARLLSSSEYTLNSALGYISLKSTLNQDEVLAVAYEYTYAGKVYQVGEFSTDKVGSTDSEAVGRKSPALLLKMLKSSNNAPKNKGRGTWDLMMKNVYSLGVTSMSSDKFELYVMYRNDSVGTELQYLPESQIKGKQLLRVLRLDTLDTRNNLRPDGKFDYVEGYTALSSSGRIIFPVLEPFGDYLRRAIGNDAIAAKYTFQELYDSTLVNAQEMTEKNKFKLTGKLKGSSGSEIRLNAMNVPRGSVTVTAGGATLVENVDYTVDYTMGVVTILNQSIIESGTKVDVKLENQATFSMQRKNLFGLHLEYAFNKDLMIGGTIMHLRERPLTTKVNSGSEPLANTIWGVNGAWKTELQWLNNAIDQIPWMTATQPSTFAINAEFAHLIPGHTGDVGKVGTAYIDDFEQTMTEIDIHYPSYWRLASTPRSDNFPEYNLSNNIEYGKNRALLSWFTPDPIFGYPQSNTPQHIKDDVDALSDHRTRIVYEQELFPNRETLANEDPKIATLNLSFYPSERGPYNLDTLGILPNGALDNPYKRWGGIMRKLDNTDFEKANIEYISFWLMDPELTNPGGYEGDLYIDLGDISEDILKDGKKSFEHGLPTNEIDDTEKTVWGRVSRTTSTVVAFSNESGSREKQDVGLDGLSNEQEFGFPTYSDYVSALRRRITDPATINNWNEDPFSPFNDPAGDNYHYYRGDDYDRVQMSALNRYKHYNGTEGNSPETSAGGYSMAATLQPDIEDINNDNTLNEYEKFYEYHVSLRKTEMEVGRQYIVEKLVTNVSLRNGQVVPVTWYQFKIPLKGANTKRVGTIRNFKSIRFARLYLTGCNKEMHLRFGSLDLVRGEWRNYTQGLYRNERTKNYNETSPSGTALLDVQNVNIEENGTRTPVNYVLPPGISRQTDPGQAQLIAQNEQAMVLRVHNLPFNDARAVYKNTGYDMRNYKHLQMFVHAERLDEEDPGLKDGDLTCFIRLGTDLKNNYYEYEIPLVLTPPGIYNNNSEADRYKVWPRENTFDFPFSVLTDAKIARNKAKHAGTSNVGNTIPYVMYDEASGKPQNRITVLGNPTLESVECIMIGVRNAGLGEDHKHEEHGAEIWVNELRMSEFNEQGGVAAMANVSLSISDIAQLNVSGRLETAGYGSIESNVLQRNMENNYQLSLSAALEAGRLFPEQAKLQIPLYVAYSNNTTSPDYDPLDTDIKLSETLSQYETKAERDSVKLMSNTVNESTSFSVTNMKVNIHSKKKDMFYDPANFSVSASYNRQNEHTPEMERNRTTEHRGQFNYAYSFNPKPWEPFSKMKGVEKVKIIKEFNIFYLPQSWAFNTAMQRSFSNMKMRDFNEGGSELNKMDITFSKDFTWSRNFDFKYDLSRNLKFSFQTAMNSTVDEGYYTPEIIRDYGFTNDYYEAWRDTIRRSLAKGGTPYTYQQVFTASWNLPINKIPGLDFITANASYNGTYNWARTVSTSSENSLGNTITGLRSWQVDGTLNFETLYNKSKYWKSMTQRYTGRQRQKAFKPKTYSETIDLEAGTPKSVTHRLGSEQFDVEATDSVGHKIKLKVKSDGNTKATVTSPVSGKITLKMTTTDPNKRTPAQVTGDMFAYIGTMFRRLQVTYRDNTSITVPGFKPQAGFMGQCKTDNAYAPGFDFAFGFFRDDFVEKAKREGWLTGDTMVVQPATQSRTTDLDIKLTLEPLPGLKIQLNGKRYMAQSNSIIYSYEDLQEHISGSFNITQVAIGTAFSRIGSQDDNFPSAVYEKFVANRDVMQKRIQEQYDNTTYPDAGFLRSSVFAGQKYNRSNGTVSRNSADVLVPAFLAAYTGRDINAISSNPFLGILSILPNWSITYDGLGKLPWMRDNFRSVTLTHAYTCKYAIGSYSTYSTWVGAAGNDKSIGFVRDVQTESPVPSAAYDISSVSLTESFSPLIGLNMTMKNSLSIKAEYRKQRNLTLNVTSVQLMEGHTNEFVIGGGYTIKNLNFITKTPRSEKKVSNDLKLNVDFSYKDVKTLLRKVEEYITQASTGNRVFGVKISADYVLSQKINIQFYYDHQGTTPLISTSYPIKTDNVGFNIKLMLTR